MLAKCVVVAFTVSVDETVCAAVHVTLDAAVTKPGFTKLMVTEPVAALALIMVPEEIDETPVTEPMPPLKLVTPVFWNWIAPEELAMPMPVEVEKVNGALNVKPAVVIVAVAAAEVM